MTTGIGAPAPNRVCDLAQIDIPIIQAPMTYIAGARLAAAVSNAGALGIIETRSEQGRADLKRVRDLTDGAVGANIAPPTSSNRCGQGVARCYQRQRIDSGPPLSVRPTVSATPLAPRRNPAPRRFLAPVARR